MSVSTRNETRIGNNEPAIAFDGIEKSFFGVKVLKDVRFSVGVGRIVGLVGENGAGKSTLMNLLGGILRPDDGSMRVNGQLYGPRGPNDARVAGIAFVHQELNLFPNLGISENLHLTSFPLFGQAGTRGKARNTIVLPWINRAALRSRTSGLLRQVGLDHPPDTPVERLTAGERQLVEIAKALGADARVIILDEPTTSLSARECERLFALMHQLRGRGISMIFISHALGDVLRHCDDLVVLRDGEVVGGGPTSEFSHPRLVTLMVGRQLNELYPARQSPIRRDSSASGGTPGQRPALRVSELTQPGIVRSVSFDLAAGEILGISGLMGAGRSELARILFGLDPCANGTIQLDGQPLSGAPRQRIQRGLAFLTEDRRQEGLCMAASIIDNMALVTLPAHSRTPARWIDLTRVKIAVGRMREAVRLSPNARDAQAVRTLSGGNQQKVVLGKWLLAEPKVLILDEPTRGIDVGAKFEIYQLIHRLANRGAGVLVISSEIEELMGLCDRMLVMRHGEITAEFHREEFDRERILAAALHESKA